MSNFETAEGTEKVSTAKLIYREPHLSEFGHVSVLVKSGSMLVAETNPGCLTGQPFMALPCPPSDARLKTDVRKLSDHPLGVSLYVYRYDRSVRSTLPDGLFFGVIAQELQSVLPEAVIADEAGFLSVDYGQLSGRSALH
jgi:hypothetical protein